MPDCNHHSNSCRGSYPAWFPSAANRRHARDQPMDQRYLETVRSCKAILRNLDYLDEAATYGQRAELNRLLLKLYERLEFFLAADDADQGLLAGEE